MFLESNEDIENKAKHLERKKHSAEVAKKWYLKNRERILEYQNKYRAVHKNNTYALMYYHNHKTEINQKRRKRYKNNNQKELERIKKYYNKNKNSIRLKRKKYYKNNKEKYSNFSKKWRDNNPIKYKEIYTKSNHTRNRELGFNPLNKQNINNEAHHIDPVNVIYIPHNIHRSTWHCQDDPESMMGINLLAWDFMESEAL